MEARRMSIEDRLRAIKRLFLDTAPIIYFVEKNEKYLPNLRIVFDAIDQAAVVAVTSPITLAECLVVPYRDGRRGLAQAFNDLIVNGNNTDFVLVDDGIAHKAAELRARYNLTLTDTIQVATALGSECDAFLTNDIALKRVSELNFLVLDEITP
jgi:predicted nucleic acid-binding protein